MKVINNYKFDVIEEVAEGLSSPLVENLTFERACQKAGELKVAHPERIYKVSMYIPECDIYKDIVTIILNSKGPQTYYA